MTILFDRIHNRKFAQTSSGEYICWKTCFLVSIWQRNALITFVRKNMKMNHAQWDSCISIIHDDRKNSLNKVWWTIELCTSHIIYCLLLNKPTMYY
jgi:hypothetical protein